MIYLLALLALVLWAVPATIVTVLRDGYHRVPFDPCSASSPYENARYSSRSA